MRILSVSKSPNNIFVPKPDFNLKSKNSLCFGSSKQIKERRQKVSSSGGFQFENNPSLLQILSDDSNLSRYEIENFLKEADKIHLSKAKEFYRRNKKFIKDYFHKGYEFSFEESQNSDTVDGIFHDRRYIKEVERNRTIRLSPKGITKSLCISIDNSMNNQIKFLTRLLGGNYICEQIYGLNKRWLNYTLMEERRTQGLLGGNYQIAITKLSPLLGAYDTTVYNIDGIDPKDVMEKIENGELKGVETAKTIETQDGIEHIEHFEHQGYKTERIYKKSHDGLKTSLDYVIESPLGEKILDLHRTFEFKSEYSDVAENTMKFDIEFDDKTQMVHITPKKTEKNTSVTTINGRKYIAEFDNDKRTVQITDDKNRKTAINFNDKISHSELLWELIKKTPADLLLDFENINALSYRKDGGKFYRRQMEIETEAKVSVLAHELGHFRDDYDCHISKNPNLVDTYNEEIEDLKTRMGEKEFQNLDYFSQTSPSPLQGLGELVAEVNLLCSELSYDGRPERELYLMRYFPRTISAAAKLLGYGVQNESK